MSLVKFSAQNHRQQVAKRGANPEVDDRATAPEVFGPLDERFHFTIDVAASAANTKCERYYDEAANGLEQSWAGERVWCNPPFSSIEPWVAKAWDEWNNPYSAYPLLVRPELIVMLLPANRTEQRWWQRHVEPYRDRGERGALTVEFLRGRMRFIRAGKAEVGPNERPPFGCCLLIWEWPK